MLPCLPNTFQTVLFQLKTPHTPTATRVSAWHELHSPLHLLIDTHGLICFLLRTDKLQLSVASRYLVFTAHHRRLALWCALNITCGGAGSHSAAWDAVLLFENCLHLQGQEVYWPWSEDNTVLRNVGSYSPNEAVTSVHPRITCIRSCIAVYVKRFVAVTSINTSKCERFIEVTSCSGRAVIQCWVTRSGFKNFRNSMV
jgi:hypothetical protein